MFGVRKVCAFEQRHPPFWRKSPAENLAYCSIYHLSSAYLPDYLAFLRDYRPEIVMGYPQRTGRGSPIRTGAQGPPRARPRCCDDL